MSWLRSLFPMLAIGTGRVRRAMARAKLREVADLEVGAWQRVDGTAGSIGDQMGTSLLDAAPCLCSRTIVDIAFYADAAWLHLVDHFQSVPFEVRDQTGAIRVDSDRLRLIGPVDADNFDDFGSIDRDRLAAILGDSHFGFREWGERYFFIDGDGYQRGVRVRETVIAEGDSVQVCGVVKREPARQAGGDAVGYRTTPTELVFRGRRTMPVLVSRKKTPTVTKT